MKRFVLDTQGSVIGDARVAVGYGIPSPARARRDTPEQAGVSV
jgi:hypothetical protein